MLKKKVVTLALTSLVLVSFISCTKEQQRVSAKAEVNINNKYKPKEHKLNKTYILKTDKVITSPKKQKFILTYYTDLAVENSTKYGGVNCRGEKLTEGMIASNFYELGTKIVIDGVTYEVSDRGSSRFSNSKRLDVFIPRNQGESNREYYKRVNNMGVRKVKGYIIE